MHRYWHLLPALALLAVLSACGSLGTIVPGRQTADLSTEQVFVASVRSRTADGAWGDNRSDTIRYMSYDVSVPPTHGPGESPRYMASPDSLTPSRDFVVAGSAEFATAGAFNAAVRQGSAADEVFVYVHGFNTSFGDSLYQLAQIGHDIEMPAARVLFAWPSQTRISGYMHDLDSATFAADALADVLNGLARAGVKRIVVAGYSMGAVTVVQAVRRIKEKGGPALSRLGGVVLLGPDIDIDVFRGHARAMGGLPEPFVVYSAPDFAPLRQAASVFAKGAPRLAMLPDPAALADLPIIFIDTQNVHSIPQPGGGHLPVATSPSLIRVLNAMERPDMVRYAQNAAAGDVPGAEVRRFGELTYVTLPKP